MNETRRTPTKRHRYCTCGFVRRAIVPEEHDDSCPVVAHVFPDICEHCGARSAACVMPGEAGGCDWNFGRRPGMPWPPEDPADWPPWYTGSTWHERDTTMWNALKCAFGFHDGKYIQGEGRWIEARHRYFVCRRVNCAKRYVMKGKYDSTNVNQVWLDGGPFKKRDQAKAKSAKRKKK